MRNMKQFVIGELTSNVQVLGLPMSVNILVVGVPNLLTMSAQLNGHMQENYQMSGTSGTLQDNGINTKTIG